MEMLFCLIVLFNLTTHVYCQPAKTTAENNVHATTPSFYFAQSPSDQSNGPCKNLVPGIEAISQGVDVTQLDLLHDYGVDNKDGFTEILFEFTCKKRRKIAIGSMEYDIPDQIQSIKLEEFVHVPKLTEVQLFEDVRVLKNHLASNVGLGKVATKGWFSESSSLAYFQNIMINSSKSIMTMNAQVPLLGITMPSKIPIRRYLSEFLVDYLSQELPAKYEDGPDRYLDFFRTYGTHYFRSASLGGSIKYWTELSVGNASQERITAVGRSWYLRLLANDGAWNFTGPGSDDGESRGDLLRVMMAQTHLRIYGGERNLYKSKGFKYWRDSIVKDPKILTGQLSPITDLIREEGKRQELVKALDIYLGLSYLAESKRLLNIYLVVLPLKVKENIESLMKKIDKVQQKDTPSYDAIKKLMDEL